MLHFEEKFYLAIVNDCANAKELLSYTEEELEEAIESEFYSFISKYGIKNENTDYETELLYNKIYGTINTTKIIYEIEKLQEEIEKVENQIKGLKPEEQKVLQEFHEVYPTLRGNMAQSTALRAGIARLDLEHKEKYLYDKLYSITSNMVLSGYVHLFN